MIRNTVIGVTVDLYGISENRKLIVIYHRWSYFYKYNLRTINSKHKEGFTKQNHNLGYTINCIVS